MVHSPHRLDRPGRPADLDREGADPSRAPSDVPSPQAAGLALTRLTLRDFRNYQTARIEVPGGCVVLCGPNGAGKTNVLEAISTLSPGRGLRGAALGDLLRHGAGGGWSVAAKLLTPDGELDIGTGLARPTGEADEDFEETDTGRRLVRVDGENAAGPAALARLLRLVWLTPQMDRLFTESASSRRRFLDRLVLGFDPEHGRRVSAYERAMRERNRLLREGRTDPSWLKALEARMAEQAVAIAASRNEVTRRLRGALAAGVGPFPRAEMTLDGAVEAWLEESSALEAEDRLVARLADNRHRDQDAGRALEGAHRTDLLVRHLEKDMPAEQCSTGEQKALLVSIVLADARLQAGVQGAAPVLLLDEIAAHLDEERRAALIDEILALGAQAWMTGTDPHLFDRLRGQATFLGVSEGEIRTDHG